MPNYLVPTLEGDAIATLANEYCYLAEQWLASRRSVVERGTSWKEWAAVVSKADAPVDVHGAKWAAVEVLNGLNHMEALLGAIELLGDCRLDRCMPTQQSFTSDKTHSADLEGTLDGVPLFLEAYGGVLYRNNSKLAIDLAALERIEATHPGAVLCLAARRSAWTGCLPSSQTVRAKRLDRHGGNAWLVADVARTWPSREQSATSSVLVVQVKNVRSVTEKPS
ncbi:MAG TPA: hypothetical protein VF407_17440 [Polyangiaceae bacterium]